jgi:hypothetical protein
MNTVGKLMPPLCSRERKGRVCVSFDSEISSLIHTIGFWFAVAAVSQTLQVYIKYVSEMCAMHYTSFTISNLMVPLFSVRHTIDN